MRTVWITLFVMTGALLFVSNAQAQAEADVEETCETEDVAVVAVNVGLIYEFTAPIGPCAEMEY